MEPKAQDHYQGSRDENREEKKNIRKNLYTYKK